MAGDVPSKADDLRARVAIRAPIAVVALPFILGIVLDRWLDVRWSHWSIVVIVAALLAAVIARRALLLATGLLLIGCIGIGGMRHHLAWTTRAGDDVSRLVTTDPRPLQVVGIIASPIAITAADESVLTPTWMQVDRSMCDLRCETMMTNSGSIPISGTARLIVTGHLLHVGVGDRVEVSGRLISPRGPTNPGAHDYRDYLQRQGVRSLVDCDHPNGVKLVTAEATGRIARWRSELRVECERIFVRDLDPRTVPLAVSLLLGERSQLPSDVRDAFAQSGTMHLLAISGLHVGILAGLLLVGCRLLNLSVLQTTLVVLIGIAAYAFVTNLRPPVIRASVLAVVMAAGWPAYRSVGAVNLVAVCGLIVLLINPTDLFDVGTQLSFLAVIAIGSAASFIAQERNRPDEDSLLRTLFTPRDGVWSTLLRLLAEGYVVTAAIWLFTLPLTAACFHIAAPVGFVINVLLIPYVAFVLGLGFCTMVCGMLLPWFVSAPALLFDLSLHGLLKVVDAAAALQLGHVHLSGPPTWWLIVFYLTLAGTLMLGRLLPKWRWGWTVVWSWVIVGQLAAIPLPHRDSLRCTFLDVGHGCCVVLELPDGRDLLYDAGMFAGDRRGRQVIQSALWELGLRKIDGIIVSHADVDHFNAAAGLMQTMPVGTLLCSRSLLDFDQETVAALCNTTGEEDVPVKFLQAGDQLPGDAATLSLHVLHPADDWRSEHDNANSVVVRVDFAGRSILLTGDLEREGLLSLLGTQPDHVDVLLSPHHGSRLANPPSLAAWADPDYVIVSGGKETTADMLRSVYFDAQSLLTTHDSGAVTVEITSDGKG